MRRRLLMSCLALALLGLSGAMAQSEAANPCTLSFRVMCFAKRMQMSPMAAESGDWAPEMPELFYFTGGKYEPVNFEVGRLSKPIPYSGAERLTFFTSRVLPDGKTAYDPAFAVQLKPGWTDALVFAVPDLGGSGRFAAVAADASSSSLPPGHIAVYNLSQFDIVFKAEEDIYTMAPLASVDLDISGIKNNLLSIALAIKNREEFKLVYRRRWSMRPDARGIYLLYPSPKREDRWFADRIPL